MELDAAVGTYLTFDLFDLVFAALSHHVVVVELVFQVRVNDLGLADGRLASNDHARAQSGHFSI